MKTIGSSIRVKDPDTLTWGRGRTEWKRIGRRIERAQWRHALHCELVALDSDVVVKRPPSRVQFQLFEALDSMSNNSAVTTCEEVVTMRSANVTYLRFGRTVTRVLTGAAAVSDDVQAASLVDIFREFGGMNDRADKRRAKYKAWELAKLAA